MTSSATVPFLIRRDHSVIRGPEITATREDSYGLLRLDGQRLVAQWSTVREVSRVGSTVRVDRDLGPVRDVSLPLRALAGARTRWRLLPWPPRWQLVLQAGDLQAFRALADEAGLPLDHPAELVLDLRRTDRGLARQFAAELDLALAEDALEAAERDDPLLPGHAPESATVRPPMPPAPPN
jgi:hypothetical protein